MSETSSETGVGAREKAAAAETRTLVVSPYPTSKREASHPSRSPEARREEAVGLARAIDLKVVGAELVPLAEIRPATYIGKGKVAELAERVGAERSSSS